MGISDSESVFANYISVCLINLSAWTIKHNKLFDCSTRSLTGDATDVL